MKTRLFLTMSLCFMAMNSALFAQVIIIPQQPTPLVCYKTSGPLYVAHYVCEVEGPWTLIYDRRNKFGYNKMWKNKDGSPVDEDVFKGFIPTIEIAQDTNDKIGQAIRNGFPLMDRKLVLGERLRVKMRFDSGTGRVIEVYFEFKTNSRLATLSPDKYVKAEQSIRNNVQVKVTPAGKKLDHVVYGWSELF